MPKNLPSTALIVEAWLMSRGFNPDIRFLDQPTDTSQAAADALGVNLGQIAKSLIFYEVLTNTPVLLIVSGPNRVDKQKVGEFLKTKIKTASPEFVLETTGFTVGGVPPVAHKKSLRTLIDQDLMRYDIIYVAAGNDHSLFAIPPQILLDLSSAEVISIC